LLETKGRKDENVKTYSLPYDTKKQSKLNRLKKKLNLKKVIRKQQKNYKKK